MPIHSCQLEGKEGFKWGDAGKCYIHDGTEASMKKAKKKALAQGYAIGDFSMEEFHMNSEEYTSMEFSTSFDFDGTLSTREGQSLYQRTKGTKYVITARSKDESDGVYQLTDKLGIPRSRVIFTGSNKEKIKTINRLGISKHIDNNKRVIDQLGDKGTQFTNRTVVTRMQEEMEELKILDILGRYGKEQPLDFEILHEEDFHYENEEILMEEENNLLEVKFANEKVNGLFVYYKYDVKKDAGQKFIEGTRNFCRTMLKRNRLYTKDEILKLGSNDLGTNIWSYRGGFWNKGDGTYSKSCRHIWKRVLSRKKL